MKKLLIAVLSLLAVVAAQAQGTFSFSNTPGGNLIDAAVFDGTGAKLSGADYLLQIWAGPTADSLLAASTPQAFRTQAAAAGYIAAVTATANNVAPDANGIVEARVWRVAAGATFDAAFASSDASPLGNYLKSNPLTVKAGGAGQPPGLPTAIQNLTWQNGGKLVVIPEPSVIALGVLGGLALLIRRRK